MESPSGEYSSLYQLTPALLITSSAGPFHILLAVLGFPSGYKPCSTYGACYNGWCCDSCKREVFMAVEVECGTNIALSM